MHEELLSAIDKIADTSFDPTKRIASRPSGSERQGFHRPGERAVCLLDRNNHPFPIEDEPLPKYFRIRGFPSDDDKRVTWHLQNEYLAGRIGKDEQENVRLWNTAKWIDKLYRIATMPANATPPVNTHIADALAQDTGAPTGPDDESPDPKQDNEGFKFERINVGKPVSSTTMKVTDDNGTVRRLEIKTDDYSLLRLADELDECDGLTKIDVKELMSKSDPLPERIESPDPIERKHAIKILYMLMLRMRTLWKPVIHAIAEQVTMASLGISQGVGDDKAATVGRWRVIEGLRLAESIRKRLSKNERNFSAWVNHIRTKQEIVSHEEWCKINRYKLGTVDEIIEGTLAVLPTHTAAAVARKPLAMNDNQSFGAVALSAA